MLHPKFQDNKTSGSGGKKIIKVFTIHVYIGLAGPSFEQTMMGWSHRFYIPSFVKIGLLVLEKIFEGFYYIWAWRPPWSCDPDAAKKLSFPLPKEAPHKIWL